MEATRPVIVGRKLEVYGHVTSIARTRYTIAGISRSAGEIGDFH